FRAVRRGTVTGRVARRLVRNRNLEARPEQGDLVFVHLFLLVGDVATFTRLAHAVALHGVRQYQRGPALRFHGLLVGVVYLPGVVPAAIQFRDLVVAQVGYEFEQLRIFPKEVLPDIGAVLGDVGLPFAVDHFRHALLQQAR